MQFYICMHQFMVGVRSSLFLDSAECRMRARYNTVMVLLTIGMMLHLIRMLLMVVSLLLLFLFGQRTQRAFCRIVKFIMLLLMLLVWELLLVLLTFSHFTAGGSMTLLLLLVVVEMLIVIRMMHINTGITQLPVQ